MVEQESEQPIGAFQEGPAYEWPIAFAQPVADGPCLCQAGAVAPGALEQTTRRAQVLQTLSDSVLTCGGLEAFWQRSLECLRTALRVDMVLLLLLKQERRTWKVEAACGPGAAVCSGGEVPLEQEVVGRIVASQAPMMEEFAAGAHPLPCVPHPWHTLLGVPLRAQDQVIGVLLAGTVAPRHLTHHEGQLALFAADLLVLGREHVRLHQAEVSRQATLTAQAGELEAIFETMTDGLVVYDHSGYITRMNPAAHAILGADASPTFLEGAPQERMVRLQMRDRQGQPLPEGQSPIARLLRGEVLQGTEVVELLITTLDRRERYLTVSGAPIRDAVGQITGAIALFRDVTERRQRDREAAARAAQLETILEAITDEVLVYGPDGQVLYLNPAGRRLLGCEAPPAFLERPLEERAALLDMRDPQGQPLPREHWPMLRLLRGEVLTGSAAFDMWIRTLEGRDVLVNISGGPVRDPQGQSLGAVMLARDLTERWQWEQYIVEAFQALLAMAEVLVQGPAAPTATGETTPTGDHMVAHRLLELIRQVFQCRRASLLLLEQATGQLRPMSVVGFPPDQKQAWLSIASQVHLRDCLPPAICARLEQGEVVLNDTTPVSTRGVPTIGGPVTLIAPLQLQDTLIGILALDHEAGRHRYPAEDTALAQAVAKLAVLVIERERLLEERAQVQGRALALEEVNRRMDAFIALAAHELRNPLTALKGTLQLIIRREVRRLQQAPPAGAPPTDAEESQLTQFAGLVRQAERMERLITDLLDASRIRVGKLEIRPTPCDLARLVQEQVQEQQRLQPDRTIHLDVASEGPVSVLADADRIGQVVTNYLTNALKYSQADCPVTVVLQVEGKLARVRVRDQGPGIPVAEQARIWESFHRVPGIQAHSSTGGELGLGLHLSRTIIERHGGQVGVESVPGEGSTFWFTLPLLDA
jgi:signal transduction histidine kinase/PAS domain-containing protein